MNLTDVKADVEMEKKLLSALMLKDGVAVPEATEILKAEDFYRPEHKEIYRAIVKLNEAGTLIDILLVERELELAGKLKSVTRKYLYGLLNSEHTTGRVPEYATAIKEMSQLRRMIEIGRELVINAQKEQATVAEILAETEQKLTEAAGQSYQKIKTAHDFAIEVWTELTKGEEETRGLATGLLYLDTITSGLKKSDLIILAARPSMGKTALALNIVSQVARGHVVLLFSLEMSRSQLGVRFISSLSRINAMRVQNRTFTDGELQAVLRATTTLAEMKMFVDDTMGITLTELKTKARKIKREHGLDLIVIDYLQLIQCDDRYKGNRVQEVSELSRGLKALARELDVPILALSQLSRAVEMRAEKKPQLSDLRESGSIEQDADIVMFLYREEYYEHDTTKKNIAELIIAKNRNGATGVVPLKFEKEYVLFSNLLKEDLS
ncbi:MAG: replicative DNA helicase [Selenomonadaceae bacterium]|nr:replicative DNA helicase [Selenomonadaceae bacterium]